MDRLQEIARSLMTLVNVSAINADAKNIKALSRHGLVDAVIKDNTLNANVPVNIDTKNIKVLSRHGLVDAVVKDNNVDANVPVNIDLKDISVL
ncbi:hypothetical protein BGX34_011099 [Mortierella sp. NVP85]|nr:hypothetical protein BGX34_011099 [Mortierella sp. NVP85]